MAASMGSSIVVQEREGKRSAPHSRVMIPTIRRSARCGYRYGNQLTRNVEKKMLYIITHTSGQTLTKYTKIVSVITG
jgi:ATP-dependent protease ClpP protease subunit